MYVRNRGQAIPPFGAKSARYVIKGAGFGSLLASLFKRFVPSLINIGKKALTSNIAKTAASSGAEALAGVALDALKSKNVKNSTKANLGRAKNKVIAAVESTLAARKEDEKAENRLKAVKRAKALTAFKTQTPAKRRKKHKGKFIRDKDDVTENSSSFFNENRALNNDIFD